MQIRILSFIVIDFVTMIICSFNIYSWYNEHVNHIT